MRQTPGGKKTTVNVLFNEGVLAADFVQIVNKKCNY